MRAVRPPLSAVLAALVVGGCIGAVTESSAPVDQRVPGAWRSHARMPSTRQEVAVAALGGRVYVIGGFGASGEPVATVEAYDVAADRWESRAPLPAPIHHAAAGVVDGRLFVVGGYTGERLRWTAEPSVYEYDPAGDRWMARAPLPTPRGALAVVVVGGRLHALGGSGESVTGAHEVYDPATDRWRSANAVPIAREHLAAVGLRGRVWVIGGRARFVGPQYASVDIYDPATDSWQTGPPLPDGRGGIAAAVVAGRVLVFGGEAPFRVWSATEMYEEAGHRWIAKSPMPTPRHGIGAAVVGERVYVPGGATEPGFAATDVNESYAP